MLVHVTQAHIKNGTKSSAARCPIALAIRDTVGPALKVYVSIHSYEIGPVKERPLPIEAREFIRKYDKGFDVKPFDFEI